MFPKLNFQEFTFRLRKSELRDEIFDPVRKKFVALTPEEWVRQHVIAFLIEQKHIPVSRIGVEKALKVNSLLKRFDAVVFSRNGNPLLLIECKATGIEITEKVFDQAARYNMQLNANYFMITNGMDHFTCKLDYEKKIYTFIPDIPDLL